MIYEIPTEHREVSEIQQIRLLNQSDFTLMGKFHDSTSQRKYHLKRSTNGGKDWYYIYEFKDALNKVASYSELMKLKLAKIDIVEYNINIELIFGLDAFSTNFTNPQKIKINEPYSFRCSDYSLKKLTYDFGRYYFTSKFNQILSSPVLKITPDPDNDTSIIVTWNKINNAKNYNIKKYKIDPYDSTQIIYQTDIKVNYKQSDTIGTFANVLWNHEYLITAQTVDNFGTYSDISYYVYKRNNDTILETPKIFEPKPTVNLLPIPAGDITFKWSKVPNAQSYNFKLIELRDAYIEEPGQLLKFYKTYKFMIKNIKDTSFLYRDIQKNCKYIFKVTAQNASGVSNEGYLEFLTNDFVSVDEYNNNAISVSPNPANDYISIKIENFNLLGDINQFIHIYNSLGQCVLKFPIQSNLTDFKINIKDLPNGLYFLNVGNSTHKFWIIK